MSESPTATTDERVLLVTGAAQGIGAAIAATAARRGLAVVLADVDGPAVDATAARIVADGGRAHALALDVTDVDALTAAPDRVAERLGRLDVVCSHCGIYPATRIEDLTVAGWDHVQQVNVRPAFVLLRAALPLLRRSPAARVVLTSSITGPLCGEAGAVAYGASKAALLGLMRSAAVELAPDRITVNAVLPGNVATPGLRAMGADYERRMAAGIPLGRFAEPDEIAAAVLFLASLEAAYVTGQTLVVDGGQTLPEGTVAGPAPGPDPRRRNP